jgi:peptidylprolyl isomerase
VTGPAFVTSPGTATLPSATTPGAASGPLSKEPKMTPQSRLPGKLLINDLITGTGAEAKAGETLTVNYVGFLFHGGQEFDSSWKRGKPFTFSLGTSQVILGWNQGVPGMHVGGRRELLVPAELAYGAKGFPTPVPIPPNKTLEFVVDLLEVSKPGAGGG